MKASDYYMAWIICISKAVDLLQQIESEINEQKMIDAYFDIR